MEKTIIQADVTGDVTIDLFGNDNTIDMINLGNDLFRNSQPLTGKELDYLSDCLSKNSPSIAKIKNRL